MVTVYDDKYTQLMSNAIEELRATTDITQLVPGAKARALLEIVNRELGTAYRTFSTDLLQAFVKYSTRENLEYLAELMGITRGTVTQNEITAENQTQKFYVEGGGTFGSINTINGIPTSFTIPAGTQVYTRTLTADEQPIRYQVTDDVVCAAGSTVAYASVRAIEFGSISDVGAGSLVNHNFELYEDYNNSTLRTTNLEGIATSTDRESDVNLRYRIINQTLAAEGANNVAIRMAALSVPGVADVVLDEYSHGVGTGTVYIKGVVPVISENLIATVQAAVSRVRSFGNYVDVKQPPLVGIELVLGLNLLEPITTTAQTDLVSRVRDALYEYINGLDINDTIDPALIVRQVLAVDSNIKSTGTVTRPIDRLYIWKYSAAEDNRIRREALAGYQARNFERPIVEFTALPSGEDPIRVRVLS